MHRHDTVGVAITIATLLMGCNNEVDHADADAAGTGGPQTGSETATETPSTTSLTTTSLTTDQATTEAESIDGSDTVANTGTYDTTTDSGALDTSDGSDTSDGVETTNGDTSGGAPFGTLPHAESFEGPDGALWPLPWTEAGTAVLYATLDHGQGRLVGETGRVARMVLPGFTESDVDVTITVEFDDWQHQGVGLYVRQNGGALQETMPPGQGYAAYVEGGWLQSIGIWRETNGVEELLASADVPGGALEPGVSYRLRLQCVQQGPSTLLRTRLWPLGEPEPEGWQVELLDDTPVLQDTTGSFAVDLYNYAGTGGVRFDDLLAEPL